MSDFRINTCRVCGQQEFDSSLRPLFKYGVRHYAHGTCGLKKWGATFLDMIPQHQLGRLPFRFVSAAGLMQEVERRMQEAS